jgi:rSAM-associated Gly-rich repeat protein
MKQTRIGLISFLLSLAALKTPEAAAHPAISTPDSTLATIEEYSIEQNTEQNAEQNAEQSAKPTVDSRLTNLTERIREREQQLETNPLNADELIAKGFADGDDRGWRRSRHSGWYDGRRGEFRNSDPWRNGWRDGHRFFDWPND